MDIEHPTAGAGELMVSPLQAAKRLGISRSTLYLLLADGTVESVHVGTRRLIPVAALVEYVERLRRQATPMGRRQTAVNQPSSPADGARPPQQSPQGSDVRRTARSRSGTRSSAGTGRRRSDGTVALPLGLPQLDDHGSAQRPA